MQTEREPEVAEVIGGELQLVAALRSAQLGKSHHAGVVHQDLERAAPRAHELVHAAGVRQIQGADEDLVVSARALDAGRDFSSRLEVARRQGHFGAGLSQRARGFRADARRTSGDEGTLATQIDPRDHVHRRRAKAERRLDQLCHGGSMRPPPAGFMPRSRQALACAARAAPGAQGSGWFRPGRKVGPPRSHRRPRWRAPPRAPPRRASRSALRPPARTGPRARWPGRR